MRILYKENARERRKKWPVKRENERGDRKEMRILLEAKVGEKKERWPMKQIERET